LKPGVSQPQAEAALNVLFRQMEKDIVGEQGIRFAGEPIQLVPASRGYSMLRQQFSQPLLILMIAVGLVLLIACANVANLLLARATARHHEIRLRLAVGAGRMRLIRQLLTESLLMASIGGALGLIIASWETQMLLNLLPRGPNPIALDAHLDPRILAFTAALSVFTVVLFGLAPAFRAVRVNLGAGSGRAGSEIGSGLPLIKLLVISQVALSLLLLVSTLLFVRSLQKLKSVDLGLDPKNLLQVSIDTRGSGYRDARLATLYEELLERISSIPGVRSASASSNGLIQGHWTRTNVSVQGDTRVQAEDQMVDSADVGPRFFETVGTPLWRGRDFSAADNAAAPKVVVINEAMAGYYFGNQNPIGRRLGTGENNAEFEIVGVAKAARFSTVRQQAPLMMYFPALQRRMDVSALQVRASANPVAIAAAVRHEVQAVDKRLLVDVKTLTEQVNDSLVQERLVGTLSGFFSVLALVLANVGLYGVMAYSVTRRTSEIGIRMALGAARRDVLLLVVREAMTLVLIGLALGVPAALITARLAGHLISGLLFGLTTTDPVTIAMATVLLTGVAAIAGYLPAWRASRIDPLHALRYE
jgi:predicted permease